MRSLVLVLLAHYVPVPVRGQGRRLGHNDPCPNAPADENDATTNWCPTFCPSCDVKLFNVAQSGWSPSDDGFDGCVCVVVYAVNVASISLSQYDDCLVAFNYGSITGLNANGGDDFICTGGSADTQMFGARLRLAPESVPRAALAPADASLVLAGHSTAQPRALIVCRQRRR